MSDVDKTATGTNGSTGPNVTISLKQLLFFGAGAVALLLCFILLVGFGFFLGNMGDGGRLGKLLARPEATMPTPLVVTATYTPTPIDGSASGSTQVNEGIENETAAEENVDPTSAPAPPEIGSITFATKTNRDGEPLNPAISFEEGITEIHAVFDYDHMSKQYTWERVWYLDGRELVRNTDNWSGDESGQFDHSLDTDGGALPPGEWVLELYVDGELLATGSFTVEAKEIAQAPTSTSTPTPTPTSTATATATPATVRQTSGGRAYQLVYSKWDNGAHNLYVADTNGNNEQLVFTRAAGPSWSPDKKRLFFIGEQGVTQQKREGAVGCTFGTISDGVIGMDVRSPLGDICEVQDGDWFCDRKRVDLQSEPSDVCTANSISIYQNLDWKVGSARWVSASPDGEAIAFDAKPGGEYRIYFRAMLGTSQQFRFELVGEQGSWSPDGWQMVYRSGRDNKTGLWISNRDDSGHTNLTVEGTDSFPAWSPDGRTIAFSRTVYGNLDIYIINRDGTNLKRLTDHPGHDTLPVYTPGGEIIFRSDRTGSWGIWKMTGTGTGQTEIIPNTGVGLDWAYSKMDVR